MKNIIWTIPAAFLILTGCGKAENAKKFTVFEDFYGATIASEKGTMFEEAVDRAIPDVKHLYYDFQAEAVAAVSEGEADAVSLDLPIARYTAATNPDLVIFPRALEDDRYGFAVAKDSPLGAKANEALQIMEGRGTLKRLREAWLSATTGGRKLPGPQSDDFDGSEGTIKCGFGTGFIPISYEDSDGKPTGLDLDIVSRIAYRLNMNVEFIPMSFGELLPALAAGEIDMAAGGVSITEERQKSFDFVGPYMNGGVVLVIKRSRAGKWNAAERGAPAW